MTAVRKQEGSPLKNPKAYSTRLATNVRLDGGLKRRLIQRASDQGRHLSDLVNDELGKLFPAPADEEKEE